MVGMRWLILIVIQASLHHCSWFSYPLSYLTGGGGSSAEGGAPKQPENGGNAQSSNPRQERSPPPNLPRFNTAPISLPRYNTAPVSIPGAPRKRSDDGPDQLKRGASYGSSQQWFSYENSGSSAILSWKTTPKHEATRSPAEGYACSLSPSSFYDAVFERRVTKSFGLEYRDLEALLAQPHYFVDKSLFIRHWIDDPAKVTIFTLPRLFGKSLTLSMLRIFLDHRVTPGPGFAKLKINEPEHVLLHKHVANACNVLYFDWQAGGVLRASSIADLKVRLRNYLKGLFLDLLDQLRAAGLQDLFLPGQVDIGAYLIYEDFDDFRDVAKVILKILSAANSHRTVILIDDCETVLKKAAELARSNDDYDEFHVFFQEFYAASLDDPSLYWKACVFGTHRLANNVPFDRLLEEQKPGVSVAFYENFALEFGAYANDFGFQPGEVESATKVLRSNVEREEVQAKYSLSPTTLHPYSCAAAIKYESVGEGYWTAKVPLDPATSFILSRCPDFGPGDLVDMARTPVSLEGMQKLTLRPFEHKTRGQVQRTLLEEGYIAPTVASFENAMHLLKVAKIWFDSLTGLNQSLLALPNKDFKNLATALTRAKQIPNLAMGKPILHPDCHRKFNGFIAEMIADAFDEGQHPSLLFYNFRIPVIQTDPEEYLILFLPGIVPTLLPEIPKYITQEAKKLALFKGDQNALTLLIAYMDHQGTINIQDYNLIIKFNNF